MRIILRKATQLDLFDSTVYVSGSVDKHGHMRQPHTRIQKVKAKKPPVSKPAPKEETKIGRRLSLFIQRQGGFGRLARLLDSVTEDEKKKIFESMAALDGKTVDEISALVEKNKGADSSNTDTDDLFSGHARPSDQQELTSEQSEKLRSLRQTIVDNIATRRSVGTKIPDAWLEKIKEVDLALGDTAHQDKPESPVKEKIAPDMSGWTDARKRAFGLREELKDRQIELDGDKKAMAAFKRKVRSVAKTVPEDDQAAVMLIDAVVTRVFGAGYNPKVAAIEFAPEQTEKAPEIPASTQLDGIDYRQPFNSIPVPVFGVPAGTSKAERKRLNAEAIKLLEKTSHTESERNILAQYSGNGGVGDSLNEYYTSPDVAAAIWKSLSSLGVEGGEVLEPSSATGVFLATAPVGVRVTGVELDPTSAKIAHVLHGDRHDIRPASLERFATTDERQFEAVIGNAPFGLRGALIKDDKPELKTAEQYFLDTALDKTKPGGIVAMIVPTGIMDGKNTRSFRERLLRKGEFLGAQRMPNTAFEHAHTGVTTDVVYLRKRPDDVAGALMTVGQDTLKSVGVWDEEFLSGGYFDGRGSNNVFGSTEAGWRAKAGIGNDITVTGSMVGVPEAIAQFSSPEQGRQITVPDILAALGDDERAKERALGGAITKPYSSAKVGDTKVIDGATYILQGDPPRWHRVDEVVATSEAVSDAAPLAEQINRLMAGHGVDRQALESSIKAFVKKHGVPAKHEDLQLAAKANKTLHRLIGAVGLDGKLSDLVTGQSSRSEGSFDSAAQSLALEHGTFTVEELAGRWHGGDSEDVLDNLYAMDGYALDPVTGKWTTKDVYLSGELWPKYDAAKTKLGSDELSGVDRGKFERQLSLLDEAIDPRSLEDVEINLNSAFLPTDVIEAYFDWKNFESESASAWSKKLDPVKITFDGGVYSVEGGNPHSDMKLLDKYLNRTGVRKDDLAHLEEMNAGFKEWLCGSRFRDSIEDLYNRKFRGFRPESYSDAPIDIPGLANHDKIKGYKWPGLRWALSAGKGIVAEDVGLGKAQPLDAKILTPSGWKLMGDIVLGDKVISSDGTPTTVIGVFPQGEKDTFRVRFHDGSSTECCEEHLWVTQTHLDRNNARRGFSDNGVPKVRTLEEIRRTLTYRGMKNHAIPMVSPVAFTEKDVPIEPYVLGVLIGDGSFTHDAVSFTSVDQEISTMVSGALENSCPTVEVKSGARGARAPRYHISRRRTGTGINHIWRALVSLGLQGKTSQHKFVPECYLFNGPSVRLSILQGLMDTDGYVCKAGVTVQFNSSSERLAKDVQFLAWSLGGNATIKSKIPVFRDANGDKKNGLRHYTVHLRMPPEVTPFRLPRKAARVLPKSKYLPTRYITGIAPSGRKPCQCIMVDHPSHLYVTDDFIVTHNTLGGLLLARMSQINGSAQKPMIVVPKSVLANWAAEAEKWFPGSKVLVIGATFSRDKDGELKGQDDKPAERARKLHDLTQNHYDFVICAESVYQEVDLNPELKAQYAGDDFWVQRGDKMGNMGDKRARKVQEAYKQQIAGREFTKKTDAIYFDELGVDMIIRDEGHREKNLWAARNRFGETPKFLGGQGESNRAYDFYLKSKYIREHNNGKNVYMLTATPTKNSPLEIYSMLSHIAPEAFEQVGIRNAEEFLDRFCVFETDRIYTLDGEFEEALVTSGFKNMGELREIMSRHIDRKTAEDVGLELPSRDDRMHYLDMSPQQKEAYADLRIRLAESKNTDDATGDAHIFSIMSDMAKAAMDLELYDPEKYRGQVSPKYEAVAKNAVEMAKDGGQVIFAQFTGAHEKIAKALEKAGVPRDQIAIVNAKAANTAAKRQNISDKFNNGKLKYVIGNSTMEEGMNLQQLTSDIHHLDLPWEPASMQQRNGRGLRQGNVNEAVRIHTYVSKGTFDGYRYQSMIRKKDWQDLLWKGGDRVDNLAKEGAISHDDLAIMCADDPEAAAKAHAENRELAAQRYHAEQTSAAVKEFERYRSLKASYAGINNKNTASAQRLKSRLERSKAQLQANKFFKAKAALDSNKPVLIHPMTGEAISEGQGFEFPESGQLEAERVVVTEVRPSQNKVSFRYYGDTDGRIVTVGMDKFKDGKSFDYDQAVESKEIEKKFTEHAEANISTIKSPSSLRGLPPALIEKHYNTIQDGLKTGLKEYKWSSGSPIGFVDKNGRASWSEGYHARDYAGKHDLMLPTKAHKEKALAAWAEAEKSKRFDTRYDQQGRGRGKFVQRLELKYTNSEGERYGGPSSNPWSGAGKELFGDGFEKEAKDLFLGKQFEAARRAPTFGEALKILTPTIEHNYGTVKWPKRTLAILWAKAKRDGILDDKLKSAISTVRHEGKEEYERTQMVPHELIKTSDVHTDPSVHLGLARLAAKNNHNDLAASMLTSAAKDEESALSAIDEIGSLNYQDKWRAIHHIVEKFGLSGRSTEGAKYGGPFWSQRGTMGEVVQRNLEGKKQ